MAGAGSRRHQRLTDAEGETCTASPAAVTIEEIYSATKALTHHARTVKARQLLPTPTERRKLVFEAWKCLLLAALGGVALAFAAARGWLGTHAREFWLREFTVQGWLLIVLSAFALLGTLQIMRWLAVPFRDSRVRLFRSLSREEQSIIRVLAHCAYGISEAELCERVPAPMQHFLYLIDHLVHGLHLVERTEPTSGGAFWSLSERGRGMAAANRLFPNET